jgi:hypothetical protein
MGGPRPDQGRQHNGPNDAPSHPGDSWMLRLPFKDSLMKCHDLLPRFARQTVLQAITAAEDFAYTLEACPGAFINIGNAGSVGSCPVHNQKRSASLTSAHR